MNQWRKGIASWKVGKTLYQSIPFTWLLPEAETQAADHKGPVVAGGPAVSLMGAPWANTDAVPFDTLSFHNPLATFTTRGCPNQCPFCAVPTIEGDFRELDTWKPAPVVCDNNLLESTQNHFTRVIDSLRPFPFVDFNQGLYAGLLLPWHVDLIRSLHAVKMRFAFDYPSEETKVRDAIELCRKNGLTDIGVYCLIGYNDTPSEAHERLELVRSWGILPNPMRYQPLDCLVKNSHVANGWTERELRKTMKYYSRLVWLGNVCSYDDFQYREEDETQEVLPL